MKLRIHADQIRLRLKQSEVKDLCQGREVVEICPTLPEPIVYALRSEANSNEMTVLGAGMRITVTIPSAWLHDWMDNDRTGFESRESGVKLLIEKDYKCLHPKTPGENTDCFEHPSAG